MITQISLQNVATFGSEVQTMSDLKKLNFVFGTNRIGKNDYQQSSSRTR